MYKYKDILINYQDLGKKTKKVIVYLHGWGQNIEMMEPIAKPFIDTNRIILIDLPGFGDSEEPKEAWSLQDYVEMIHSLLESLNIKNPNIIGHSFGGKIALLYASIYKCEKLILISSPYKVKIKKQSLKIRIIKKAEKLPLIGSIASKIKRNMGSTDYKNASPMMRNILVKHVNTDLTETSKKIKCPTFIIWGSNDQDVPTDDARELESLIPDAGLVIYEGCSHYAYLERLNQTVKIIASFINKENL